MPDFLRSKRTPRLFILGLLFPCLLISIPAVLAYRAENDLSDSFHWVSHTLEVQRQLQLVLSLLDDAETGQRGFLLSGRDSYLVPYRSALERLPSELKELRALTADNPIQQKNLQNLDGLIAAKLDWIAQAVSVQESGNRDAALKLIGTDGGKQAMDAVRVRLGLMEQVEARLLVIRQEHLSASARTSTVVLTALVVLNLAFAATALIIVRRLARLQRLVTVCAWSRTVEYEGEWLSVEDYLHRRFGLDITHGISPAELERALGSIPQEKTES